MIRGPGTKLALAIALTIFSGQALAQPSPPRPAAPSPAPVAPPPATPTPTPPAGPAAPPPPSPAPPAPSAEPAQSPPAPAETVPPTAPTAPPSPAAPADPEAPLPDGAGLADGAAGKECAAPNPCDWLGNLGSLELSSAMRGLSARQLAIEPSPWGKRIGRVLVHNDDVFAEKSFLQFFNYFHITSKEDVVAREVILHSGDLWDQAKIEETARRLRDPVFSSVAVVLPVRGESPGTVDILVVTRDIWSLRFNTNYRYQDSSLTFLAASLSENNFLGRRKVLSVAYDMDQGQVGIGPLFLDKNFLGRHLEVRTRVAGLFSRDRLLDDGSFSSEGSESSIDASRPLWNLSEKWGAGLSFSHRFATERSFRGANLRTYDNPDTAEKEAVPWRYELRRWALSASVVRQFGGPRLKQRVGGGYAIESQRPSLDDDLVATPELADAFRRDVLPRSERTSLPFLNYSLFTPRYRTLRNVSTYDLAEDAQLGPTAEASVGAGIRFLGSDNSFLRGSMGAGYTQPLGPDGHVRLSASVGGRLDGGELIDNSAAAELRLVAPTLRRIVRLVAELRMFTLWDETQNRFFTIGSDNGLRGFSIGEFTGQRKVALQLEARSRPWRLAFFRFGGVLFYDAGGAANSFGTMDLHHDVGLGLRVLIPQLSRELMRFDFAFPLDGPGSGKVRFIAGFRSEF